MSKKFLLHAGAAALLFISLGVSCSSKETMVGDGFTPTGQENADVAEADKALAANDALSPDASPNAMDPSAASSDNGAKAVDASLSLPAEGSSQLVASNSPQDVTDDAAPVSMPSHYSGRSNLGAASSGRGR